MFSPVKQRISLGRNKLSTIETNLITKRTVATVSEADISAAKYNKDE